MYWGILTCSLTEGRSCCKASWKCWLRTHKSSRFVSPLFRDCRRENMEACLTNPAKSAPV